MSHFGVSGVGRFKPNIGYLQRNPSAIGSGVSVGGDIEQTGTGTPQSYIRSGSGFRPGSSLSQSSECHAIWNLYTPNVDMSSYIGVPDGSGFYFRYKDINRMWRLVMGEYQSSTYYVAPQSTEATCTGCYLTSNSVTQNEFSYECTSLYSSGTVYTSSNYSYCSYGGYSALYKYSRTWQTYCDSSCGCNPTYANLYGCAGKCMKTITRTYYQCTGGSAGSYYAGISVPNYSPRLHLEYRNGSSTWTNFATINLTGGDVGGLRLRIVGNSIIVYKGTYGSTTWTQIGSYTSSLHNDGIFHGIGIASKNANNRAVSSGIQGFTLEGI
jgi:hypothetical protein